MRRPRLELAPWEPVTTPQLAGVLAFAAIVVLLLRAGDPGWTPILDDANLAFHEAGHLVYGVLGATAALYGGLLGQLTFPVAAALTFWWRRQPAAVATVAVWGFQNLFSIARYMADARVQELPLAGGTEHDFEHIFTRWGVLDRDVVIAAWTRGLGWLGLAATLGWLGWRWRRDRAA
ncbi:MAG: hypothetical protein KJZ91_06095 [Myxococcales bacterium]|nr:hypothetical protein [Myxococcales bacterium]